MKPLIQGLVDKDAAPPTAYQSVVQAYVLNVNWADLQPVPGATLSADNAIDRAVAAARQLNESTPGLDMKLRLRVYTGVAPPDWAKAIGGPPVPFVSLQGAPGRWVGTGFRRTVPRSRTSWTSWPPAPTVFRRSEKWRFFGVLRTPTSRFATTRISRRTGRSC